MYLRPQFIVEDKSYFIKLEILFLHTFIESYMNVFCGISIMVIMPAFQAGYDGSIPLSRSIRFMKGQEQCS